MSKKTTEEEFIKKSKFIHGDKYDYSLVDYINSYTKVKIICKKHGIFEQRPNSHLNGQTCLKCVNENQTKSKDQFITDSKKIHGNRYDYNLVEYVNNETNVKIICKKHGIFEQKPTNHLNGNGCNECKNNDRRLDINYIIKKFNIKFNYKYKYDIDEYKNTHQVIRIICPIHGDFYQEIRYHIKGEGCPYCSGKKMNTVFFKIKCSIIHHNKYDYSLVDYKSAFSKVKIICPKHGIFEQIASIHLFGGGCPKCKSSKGEIKILKYLDDKNIKYEYQKIFNNCKLKTYLPFDFYLLDYNVCIEYDGEQHFRSVDYFGGSQSFEDRKTKDEIKNKYCIDNNIKLIRISYVDIENIEKILNKNLNYE
jgi:hypothetical protein